MGDRVKCILGTGGQKPTLTPQERGEEKAVEEDEGFEEAPGYFDHNRSIAKKDAVV